MAGNNELQYILKIKDEATKTMQGFGKTMSGNETSMMQFAKTATVAFAGVTAGAVALGVAVTKLGTAGGKLIDVQNSFNKLAENAGESGDNLLRKFEEVTRGTIRNADLMQNSVKASMLGIPIDKMSGLMEIARTQAVSMGEDVGYMLDSIVTGVGRASPLILDNLGITLKMGEVYENTAKSLGKSSDALTDAERKQGLLNAVLEWGKKKQEEMGGEVESSAEQFQRLTATVENIKDSLLKGLVPVLLPIAESFATVAEGVAKAVEQFNFAEISVSKFIDAMSPGMFSAIAVVGALITQLFIVPKVIGFIKASMLLLSGVSFSLNVPLLLITGTIALLAYGIKLAIDKMGGFEQTVVTIKGKLQPLIDLLQKVGERLKQITESAGISGEFGGLINFFADLSDKVEFYTERTLQIVGDFYERAKSFLAFGDANAGGASIVQAIEGIWNRLQPLRDALEPMFKHMAEQFALTGEIFRTQLQPAFADLIEVLKPLGEALLPLIIGALKIAVGIIAGIVVVITAVITGIATGLANALPYIAQALEGIIQFIRGFVQLITGILTLDLGLAWEGMKQMAKGAWDFLTNGFVAVLKFIGDFVQGVIAFFQGMYDVLVGHSIIPDMMALIVQAFTGMVKNVYNAVLKLVESVKNAIQSVKDFISGKISAFREWGSNIGQAFVDGFKNALFGIVGGIKEALDKARAFLEGHSPPQAGPFRNIDKWGENVGGAWVDGLISSLETVGDRMNQGMIDNSVSNTTNLNVSATINTPIDAQELGLILGSTINNGAY